ncbi:hypothetical protein XU18_5105 [Perkinsela sp. CCAP 1560/4]|nr:hypothetical protein XU18_5105 [Perkinsela sp. CCAP 1560/4]|eukprot:KNH01737.1 hypothetical protein XU18_5105 [Perkinsela sp. CCAP 1560/4]
MGAGKLESISIAPGFPSREFFLCQKRAVKTYSTRFPDIFTVDRKLMQPWLYSKNPSHQTGFHYNSALKDHRTWYTSRTVDFVYWGRELGMASNLHRHMRTAFDFNDTVLPTKIPASSKYSKKVNLPPEHQDSVSTSLNPYNVEYNTAVHQQRLFQTFPAQPEYTFPVTFKKYHDRLGYVKNSSTGSMDDFGIGDVPDVFRNELNSLKVHKHLSPHKSNFIPGIDAPFLGEPDTKNMQSLSKALNPRQTVCVNSGRYCAVLYINTPQDNNKLDTLTAKSLGFEIDTHSNMVLKKATLIQAAQCGVTDIFCEGIDFRYLGILSKKRQKSVARTKGSASDPLCIPAATKRGPKSACDCLFLMDRHLRAHTQLLWRTFSAKRPLLCTINGKCHTSGIGLALLSKYPILRPSTEFIFDGPEIGVTHFGGALHFLARKETSNKFPGLAEFVLLTGLSLYSGDALRLGWSDLFSPIPNIDYHFREWFENTEHLHNDAVTWQIGFFLQELLHQTEKPALPSMERVAITETRARWISEVFANQVDLEGILDSLSAIEALPLSDSSNTHDEALGLPFTTDIPSAVHSLKSARLSYTAMPYELTPLPENLNTPSGPVHATFSKFYFERDSLSGRTVARLCDPVFSKWKEFRGKEMKAYVKAQLASLKRHVYIRCEGINLSTSFDFHFVFSSGGQSSTATLEALINEAQKRIHSIDREFRIGWCTPQCGIAEIRHDKELLEVLIHDPGWEDPSANLSFPPLYLLLQPVKIFFSEWAYHVKHLLLSHSPFALKCNLRMLQKTRGDDGEGNIMSISDTLQLERRVMLRILQRADFHAVGVHTRLGDLTYSKSETAFALDNEQISTADVFEVWPEGRSIDGHTFFRRPKWYPNHIRDVSIADVERMFQDLSFKTDGMCEIDIPTDTFSKKATLESMKDAGIQVVSRLGHESVPNTQTTAYVPENVNFYEMARHPWEHYKSSWRLDGYTRGSMQYLEENFAHAEKYLYGDESEDRNYWQSSPGERRARLQETSAKDINLVELEKSPDVLNANLLKENFWNVLSGAERNVETWVKNLKEKSRKQKFDYRKELASPAEKIYDDYYYQWFIQPGVHPNPSLVKRN